MQITSVWGSKGYAMHSSRIGDKDIYYLAGLTKCDSKIACMTGNKMHYGKEEVDAYFVNCLNDSTQYDFLIFDPQGSLTGESAISEIDEQARSADLRICIFKNKNYGKGIGSWAIQTTRDFALCERELHRLSLDMSSFNMRAKEAYEEVGFCVEGTLRDVIWDNGVYADNILMSILEEEWKQIA